MMGPNELNGDQLDGHGYDSDELTMMNSLR